MTISASVISYQLSIRLRAHSIFGARKLITMAIMHNIRIDKSQILSRVRLSAFLIRLVVILVVRPFV